MPTINYNDYKLSVSKSTYSNNHNLALVLTDEEDGAMFGVATVNIDILMPNFAFIDENNLPGMGDALVKAGLATKTATSRQSGWVSYPLYEIKVDQIPDHEPS